MKTHEFTEFKQYSIKVWTIFDSRRWCVLFRIWIQNTSANVWWPNFSLISISTASLLQVWSRKFWKKNSEVSYDVKLRLKHAIRSQMMWLRFLPLTMFRLQYWQHICGDQWWIKLQLVFFFNVYQNFVLNKNKVISNSYLI